MPREIWNEGRVVGLSAYSIYIKEFLETNPGEEPASEREWLASSLALGASMLVKIPVDASAPRTNYSVEIPFPTNSCLCAANTIIGSFFHGDATPDANGWATKVTDYGELISNTSSSSPSGSMIPRQSPLTWSDAGKDQMRNYLKIVDGIIIQPGDWSTASSTPPQKDLKPDMGSAPTLRLHLSESVDTAFWLLLTGFSIRTVVTGESGVDGSVGTDSPQDGDFLGPACFPWANKIVFSIPLAAVRELGGADYNRTIDPIEGSSTSQTESVDDSPIIDLKYPNTYYSGLFESAYYPGSKFSYTVNTLNKRGDGASILAVLPRYNNGSPGLYACRVTSTGQQIFEPVDCHAPGAVKLIDVHDADATKVLYAQREAMRAPNLHTLTFGSMRGVLNMEQAGNAYYEAKYNQATQEHSEQPIARSYVEDSNLANFTAGAKKYTAHILTGTQDISVLSMVKYNSSTNTFDVLPTAGATHFSISGINSGDLNWDMLMGALGNNVSLDIVGARLKQLRTALENSVSTGTQYAIVLQNNNIGVEPVAALPNFFFTSLNGVSKNYSTVSGYTGSSGMIYDGIHIDLIGFSSDGNTINSFGVLTTYETTPNFHVNGSSWMQQFQLSNTDTDANNQTSRDRFDALVTQLLSSSYADSNSNVVKIMCAPVTGYRAGQSNTPTVNDGAPSTSKFNAYVAYINVTNGTASGDINPGSRYDGILYVRNECGTQIASTTGVLSSASILNMTYRPSCRRTDGPFWTIS